jgi:predicted ribosome quality control (RQC) complex YloA/Tae2 family protein
MSLNWREIDAVLAEIDLRGSRLGKVRQPDYRRVIFQFTGPRHYPAVAIVLVAPFVRIHTLDTASGLPASLPRPPRFAAVLKSRIEGARFLSLSQLGRDRIVRFTFESGGRTMHLDAKLWGGGANLVLSDYTGVIIDTFSRRPLRKESPGENWPPPGIGVVNPGQVPAETYQLRELPGEGSWNERLEIHYRNEEERYAATHRTDLWKAHLGRRRLALELREDSIKRGMAEFQRQSRDGHWADIIMAHLHEISKGMKELEAEDWENPDTRVIIPLNPKITPIENAQAFYNRQKRAQRALLRLEEDLEAVRRSRLDLEVQQNRLEAGETDHPPLNSDPPVSRGGEHSPQASHPGLWITRGNFIIAVGRNATESETLLRQWARGNDHWLHVRDWPGGHVFIRAPRGKSVPLDVLLDAGNLALSYSKARSSGKADVYHTLVKHLRRPGDGKPGTVLPTHEKNLHIILDTQRLENLKSAAELD